MKLSEMNTEQLAACLCKLAELIGVLTADEEIEAVIKQARDDKGKPVYTVFGGGLAKLVPLMLKKHEKETYGILAALTGKSVAELKGQNGLQTIKDAKDCFDKELLDFFK